MSRPERVWEERLLDLMAPVSVVLVVLWFVSLVGFLLFGLVTFVGAVL